MEFYDYSDSELGNWSMSVLKAAFRRSDGDTIASGVSTRRMHSRPDDCGVQFSLIIFTGDIKIAICRRAP